MYIFYVNSSKLYWSKNTAKRSIAFGIQFVKLYYDKAIFLML